MRFYSGMAIKMKKLLSLKNNKNEKLIHLMLFLAMAFTLEGRSISNVEKDGIGYRFYDETGKSTNPKVPQYWALSENDFPPMLNHEAQGQGNLYKGSIGKYQITMQLNAMASSPSNPDVFPVKGVYWYGNWSNVRMTIKGILTYKTGSVGVYKLDEYDPQGKKCGSFILNEKTDFSTYLTTITGTMTNAKGTTYKVQLDPQ